MSGRVVDFATNVGISGASVTFKYIDRSGRSEVGGTTVSDPAGSYTLTLPAAGEHDVTVDTAPIGFIRLTGAADRGDLFIHPATCVARYGIITDPQTRRPVAGATVSLLGKTVNTEGDGWYRIDLGCPTRAMIKPRVWVVACIASSGSMCG